MQIAISNHGGKSWRCPKMGLHYITPSTTETTTNSAAATKAATALHQLRYNYATQKKYFASSDPHHGIQFIPSDNLSGISIWHSIWHVF